MSSNLLLQQYSFTNHWGWNLCLAQPARPTTLRTILFPIYCIIYIYIYISCIISPAKKSSSKKTPTSLAHHLSLVESLLVTDRQALWHPALVIEGNYKPWRELWQWGKLLYSPPPGALTCRHTEINCYKTSDELDAHMHIVKLLERRKDETIHIMRRRIDAREEEEEERKGSKEKQRKNK